MISKAYIVIKIKTKDEKKEVDLTYRIYDVKNASEIIYKSLSKNYEKILVKFKGFTIKFSSYQTEDEIYQQLLIKMSKIESISISNILKRSAYCLEKVSVVENGPKERRIF